MSSALPETFVVDITANEIEMGLRKNCRHCPLALALFLRTGMVWSVTTTKAARYGSAVDTHDADDFLGRFDAGYSVEPRTVTLTVSA